MFEDWAIIVGVKDYRDPNLNTLQGPVDDAQSFYDWLVRPDVGEIELAMTDDDPRHPDRIKFVTSRANSRSTTLARARPNSSDLFATVEEIIDWLEEYDRQGRRLYIYMSGHGCTPLDSSMAENVALLMANARLPDRAMHNFPATACAKFMRRRDYFREVVLIMDCCRSKMANASSPAIYSAVGDTTRNSYLVEAYATSWDSVAHEFIFPPQHIKRGVFTRALLACLNSGKLTGFQLKESVQQHVHRDLIAQGITPEMANERRPRIVADPDEYLNTITFAESAAPPRTLVTVNRRRGAPDPELFYTGSWPHERVKRRPDDPDDPWQWLLEPGRFGIKVGDVEKTFTVFAALPQEVEI